MAIVYLGLGSNLGDRERNIHAALALLEREMEVLEVSSIYETEPVGYADQPWFLNAACRVQTDLSPPDLLRLVKRLEEEVGREPTFRWGPRAIDVDILLYDDLCLSEAGLEIPHPRLAERAFVLTPLREIAGPDSLSSRNRTGAGDLVHPATGERISDLEEKAARTSQVRLWKRRSSCTK